MISRIIIIIFFTVVHERSFAQVQSDLRTANHPDSIVNSQNVYQLGYRKLILPASLITVGAISFAIPAMKKLDVSTKIEISHDRLGRTTLDNYTQYFPVVMVYGLNLAGVKGKHGFKDRTIIYATSQLISAAIVTPAKNLIAEERPDGSNRKSFPSGHAATAFSTAHFMYKEYRDNNLLLSLAGYPFAAFTGVYRVLNNKHWMTDVVAGAGGGILSTELAYWLYPKMNALIGGKRQNNKSIVVPYYQSQGIGMSYLLVF